MCSAVRPSSHRSIFEWTMQDGPGRHSPILVLYICARNDTVQNCLIETLMEYIVGLRNHQECCHFIHMCLADEVAFFYDVLLRLCASLREDWQNVPYLSDACSFHPAA